MSLLKESYFEIFLFVLYKNYKNLTISPKIKEIIYKQYLNYVKKFLMLIKTNH